MPNTAAKTEHPAPALALDEARAEVGLVHFNLAAHRRGLLAAQAMRRLMETRLRPVNVAICTAFQSVENWRTIRRNCAAEIREPKMQRFFTENQQVIQFYLA